MERLIKSAKQKQSSNGEEEDKKQGRKFKKSTVVTE
jgi:hypothetical protein